MTVRPAELIRRTAQAFGSLYAVAAPGGLTLPQFAVLSALDRFGPRTSRQLSDLTGMDRSTIFVMVRRLNEASMITMAIVESDRKGRDPVQYSLDRAGKRALAKAEPHVWNAEVQIMDGLTPPEKSLFLKALRLVAYRGAK